MLNWVFVYKNANISGVVLLTGVKEKQDTFTGSEAAYQVSDDTVSCSRKEGTSEAAAATELSPD